MKGKVDIPEASTALRRGHSSIVTATANGLTEHPHVLARARVFAEPLIAGEMLDTGENALVHADAVAAILRTIGGAEAVQAAIYLPAPQQASGSYCQGFWCQLRGAGS